MPTTFPLNRAARRRLLRYPEVVDRVGLCKRSIEEMVLVGDFVQPVKIGVRAVGFVEEEVDAWIDERITVRDQALATKTEARQA
ncbi:Prophage CP4-57 regulatory protein (AlpA) [compost metagenome]